MRLEPRRAVPETERAALIDLWVDAWTLAMPAIDFGARVAWFAAHIDGLMAAGALLLLALDGEDIAGFITLHLASGTIDQLAVAPAHGGRGTARALLDEAKRLSPQGLALRVNQGNGRAVRLYERAGFVVTETSVNARSGLPVWGMAWRP